MVRKFVVEKAGAAVEGLGELIEVTGRYSVPACFVLLDLLEG
jgi:hypothetical protein